MFEQYVNDQIFQTRYISGRGALSEVVASDELLTIRCGADWGFVIGCSFIPAAIDEAVKVVWCVVFILLWFYRSQSLRPSL